MRPLTARPGETFVPGTVVYASDAPDAAGVVISAARTTKDAWLLTLEGVADRTAAEAWRGLYLWAEQDPANADEPPYAADLVGLRMELSDGSVIGTVSDFYDLPQGPILEVTRADDTVLFPVRPEFVSRVDRERLVLVVDPPPGLFD